MLLILSWVRGCKDLQAFGPGFTAGFQMQRFCLSGVAEKWLSCLKWVADRASALIAPVFETVKICK